MGSIHEIERWKEPILIVTAPAATNPNLQAQQGIFTKANLINALPEEMDRLSLNEVLESAAKTGVESATASKMFRFILLSREAPKLLWLLGKMDITASTVRPGYAGIVDELKQRALWVVDY